MLSVDFYNDGFIPDIEPKYAIIAARYQNQWLLARHKMRATWEIPGGHREEGEFIDDTARRELYEETGALKFEISAVCYYSVTIDNEMNYGKLYYSDIQEIGLLPDMEIGETKLFDTLPENLTYPLIQPLLFNRIKEYIKTKEL
jgi:8-oxo-dGTP diphosphatase